MVKDSGKKKGGPGRRKIEIEYIEDKKKRGTAFSKRKNGIMKKAHELTTLTGCQALMLVAANSGHIYTFATDKFQPLVSTQKGKSIIQHCLDPNECLKNKQDNDALPPVTGSVIGMNSVHPQVYLHPAGYGQMPYYLPPPMPYGPGPGQFYYRPDVPRDAERPTTPSSPGAQSVPETKVADVP